MSYSQANPQQSEATPEQFQSRAQVPTVDVELPAVVRWLVRMLCEERITKMLEGDMLELFARCARRSGITRARWAFLVDAPRPRRGRG